MGAVVRSSFQVQEGRGQTRREAKQKPQPLQLVWPTGNTPQPSCTDREPRPKDERQTTAAVSGPGVGVVSPLAGRSQHLHQTTQKTAAPSPHKITASALRAAGGRLVGVGRCRWHQGSYQRPNSDSGHCCSADALNMLDQSLTPRVRLIPWQPLAAQNAYADEHGDNPGSDVPHQAESRTIDRLNEHQQKPCYRPGYGAGDNAQTFHITPGHAIGCRPYLRRTGSGIVKGVWWGVF